jgi:hypothetical protein
MALLFIVGYTALGLSGCGSSGNDSEFVVTTAPQTPNTGSLTFNFVAAQEPFVVDAGTAQLRFDFYDNAGALGDPVVSATVAFQPSITIEGLITSIRSVKITGLDADGIPIFTIVQAVTVVGGQNTVVEGLTDPTPVTLLNLALVGANSIDGVPLDGVNLEVNGTGQVYLLALFSDDTVMVVSDAATYSNDPNDPDSASIVQIGQFGELRGLSPGSTSLIAEFGGQTLTIPVTVETALNETFSEIVFASPSPLTIPEGTSAVASVDGIRESDGFVFGINPASPNLSYEISGDAGITVDDSGLVTVADLTPGGSEATLTATYQNADGSTVSSTLQIVVSGAAGVDSITAGVTQTNLYTGVPILTSQVTIQEALTDQTTQAGDPSNYDFTVDDESVASVSTAGVITAVGPGVATITATSKTNPSITDAVTVTVENASVAEVNIEPPSPGIPAGQSLSFELTATLNNAASTQIDVTSLAGFSLSDPSGTGITVADNVVTVAGGTTPGTQATVTGSFDPDGPGALNPSTSSTLITTL